ncbi:phenylalanine--tRNA ligase subunit beta [Poseidonibacter ostreae]|uniref:Phenylalanine--tRNA ligase beta subunit n=1 Tax=Poseidonibacter ostreae TaxID=2654171 RepID=A0A6L4WSK8_9BACT|nr:phenylalanine--tRNA ligase subunit beta [Poseidonibacter ostreae]KAB7888716.1 phenylalanine--tRNA ligase subunit beta [Poseidonibacter ostreae]KAB7892458.1 phenylalanine--tRNA ligase subunit beta [Poseidonibacter ostreae]
MIITRTWIEEFIDISEISTDDICKTLNSIGLEVDSLEQVSIAPKVVVGKVLEKVKHPDADKLNICQVDIGVETVQIVCGAKNVDAGQFVPVAVVGCKLSPDFKIKKAKLRGVESNGMICSSTELGLAKLNDGILELDDSIGELILGRELSEYKLLNDDIIEIELTANRGDCLSINGVARELSAFYNIPLNTFEKNVTHNDLGIGQILDIQASDIDASLIFKAVDLKDFKLDIMTKLRTAIIGKHEEDNDVKNALTYATHCTGVILNAYEKNKSKTEDNLSLLEIRKDENNFDTVYGKEELSTICIDHKKIDNSDTDFIIEASYLNPEKLSMQVFETKITTGEIYYRTSRGSEPDISYGIDYLTTFLSSLGAKIYKGRKSFIEDSQKATLDVAIAKVNAIIGQDIPELEVERILSSLGFEVKDTLNHILNVKIPFFRHDIKNIADVTEEIVRIIGIDNIQAKPMAIDEVNRINHTTNDLIKKNKLRAKACENGFDETLTYVFASRESLKKYSFPVVKEELELLNPIVKELNTFRTTIVLNLIEACASNYKIGAKATSFFEIGTIFDENRNESKKISFIQTGANELEDVSNSGKPGNVDLFKFAKKILNTIGKFDLEPMEKITNDFIHPYQNANVIVDGEIIGFISKVHPSVCEDYDLSDTFIAEIDFDSIKNELVKTKSYSKFQASKKDLSIITPKTLAYKEIKNVINSLDDVNIKQYNLIDVYTDENLGENESLTIRFVLQNDEKTMEEEDITASMNNILEALEAKLSIGLR